MNSTQHRAALAAAAAVALVALTGCSGGGSLVSGTRDTVGSAAGVPAPATAEKSVRPATSDTSGANRTVVATRAVIRTGQISLTSTDVGRVRREIDDLLRAVGGSVDDEHSTNARDGSLERTRLTLRVPVDRFDTVRNALERLGTLKTSTQSQQDVTTEVIDTTERVQTLQNSLDRLQRFQRRATDVRDLIRYENQITARQAELQSLTAQRSYLADQTSMSTITVTATTPQRYVAPPSALQDAGFLAGLTGGWHALVGVVVVSLTVLGAVLPFAAVVVLVGVPAWVVLRRRRTAAPTTPTAG